MFLKAVFESHMAECLFNIPSVAKLVQAFILGIVTHSNLLPFSYQVREPNAGPSVPLEKRIKVIVDQRCEYYSVQDICIAYLHHG